MNRAPAQAANAKGANMAVAANAPAVPAANAPAGVAAVNAPALAPAKGAAKAKAPVGRAPGKAKAPGKQAGGKVQAGQGPAAPAPKGPAKAAGNAAVPRPRAGKGPAPAVAGPAPVPNAAAKRVAQARGAPVAPDGNGPQPAIANLENQMQDLARQLHDMQERVAYTREYDANEQFLKAVPAECSVTPVDEYFRLIEVDVAQGDNRRDFWAPRSALRPVPGGRFGIQTAVGLFIVNPADALASRRLMEDASRRPQLGYVGYAPTLIGVATPVALSILQHIIKVSDKSMEPEVASVLMSRGPSDHEVCLDAHCIIFKYVYGGRVYAQYITPDHQEGYSSDGPILCEMAMTWNTYFDFKSDSPRSHPAIRELLDLVQGIIAAADNSETEPGQYWHKLGQVAMKTIKSFDKLVKDRTLSFILAAIGNHKGLLAKNEVFELRKERCRQSAIPLGVISTLWTDYLDSKNLKDPQPAGAVRHISPPHANRRYHDGRPDDGRTNIRKRSRTSGASQAHCDGEAKKIGGVWDSRRRHYIYPPGASEEVKATLRGLRAERR